MDLNIRNVPAVLVRELKRRALEDDESLREWVIGALERAVGTLPVPAVVRLHEQDSGPTVQPAMESATIMPASALKRPSHNQKTCRIYKCLQCAAMHGWPLA